MSSLPPIQPPIPPQPRRGLWQRMTGRGAAASPVPVPYTPPTGLPSQGAAVGDTVTISGKNFRNRFGPLLGIAGALGAGWFMVQSYRGHQPLWEVNFADHHAKAEMNYLQSTWAHWSGNPAFDELHHQGLAANIFGPWGIRTKMAHAQAYINGFINDVLLSNIIPIGLGITSIYFGFGPKNVHTGVKRIGTALLPKGKTDFAAIGAKAFDGTVKGVSKTATGFWSLFRNGKAPFTIILGALGLFGLYQFRRTWNHQTQEDLFRDFTAGLNNHGGGGH